MERVRALFNEVKIEMLKIAFIYTLLNAVMVFFIIFFILSFFNIKFLYLLLMPGLITFFYFIIGFIRRVNKMRLKDMEDANPQLREMLRTAHDNQKEDNMMVNALFLDLKGRIRTASSGNLLDSKIIMTRIISAVAIVFLIIFVSSISIDLDKIDIPFEKLNFMKANGGAAHQEGKITDLVFNQTDVIYGDSSIAKLGNDKLNINVNSALTSADFTKVSDAEDRQFAEGGLPQEIGVTADAFNNQKILEEAEQAANYSQRIRDI